MANLYGIIGEKAVYFDSKEKLDEYIKENKLQESKLIFSEIEYIGDYKGKNNVVKEKIDNEEACFYSFIGENSFAYYGNNGWEVEEGNIDEFYSALMEYGFISENNQDDKYIMQYKSK